jgi:hypothetical protein
MVRENRAECCCCNATDLHSGGTQFDSGHMSDKLKDFFFPITDATKILKYDVD